MKSIKLALLLLLSLTLVVPMQANPIGHYSFSQLTTEDGLPSSNVRCVFIDSYGFAWIGTKNGLCRYDGQHLQDFICYDQTSDIGNNNIVSLCEDGQHNIWVGTDLSVFRMDRQRETFTRMKITEDSAVFGDWVKQMCTDVLGNVWAIQPSGGISRYESALGTDQVPHHYLLGGDAKVMPYSLLLDDVGRLWIGSQNHGLYSYNPKTDTFSTWVGADGQPFLPDHRITSIAQADAQTLILASDDGLLLKVDLLSHSSQLINYSHEADIYVNGICCLEGQLWVASVHGLYLVNLDNGSQQTLLYDAASASGISDNDISCIYRDPYQGLWIGTNFGGVNLYSPASKPFTVYAHSSDPNSLPSNRIRGLAQAADGSIWVGSEGGGLRRIDARTLQMSTPGNVFSQHVLSIRNSGNHLFLGLFHNGLDVLQVQPDGKTSASRHSLSDLPEWTRSVYATLLDSHGNEWVAVDHGLLCRRSDQEEYTPVKALEGNWCFDIIEATDGSIWIGTRGSVVHYNTTTGVFSTYKAEDGRSGLRSSTINALKEDSHGRLWVASDRGGLALYHPESDTFETFGRHRGLPDNVCYDILEDRQGRLWFGTNSGLVCFCPDDTIGQNSWGPLLRSIVYTTGSGLPGNQFNYHSACEGSDGTLWFGTTEGLFSFLPEQLDQHRTETGVFLTSFMAAGKSVPFDAKEITLPYDNASFSFQISSPDFADATKPQYSYLLSPINKEWQDTPADGELNLVGLAPGNYTLQVKADRLGKESIYEMHIRVLPPWYRSWWAYLSYFALLILAVAAVFLYYRNLTKKRLAEHKKLYALQMEKQLNANKVQFFTEIAHEIRTPLTLIDSPLEAMEDFVDSDRFMLPDGKIDVKSLKENGKMLKGYVDTMRRNTKRLLDLTSQLLDFQKIGQRRLKLHYETVEVRSMVDELISHFQPTFQLRRKILLSNLGEEDILAVADKEALTKIISNLLNNALKYCRQEAEVQLSCDEQKFTLKVISDSDPIAKEDQERIFEAFYQVDGDVKHAGGGVGIGLPLSRQLARQHKGNLYVKVEEGNQFILEIPLNREALQQQNSEKVQVDRLVLSELQEESQENSEIGYALLLVEDNEEMLQFLAEQLSHYYTIFTAGNGQEALKVLQDHPVDLILTDVMMPVMDGFQLCQELKKNETSSNVPVVFLTAKNDTDSKVKGLQYGAEAYIEKPFSMKYLRQQLQSILDNRRRERISFQKKPFFNVDNMKVSKQDEEFMQKVIRQIEKNMANEEFSTEQLADDLCMSRSTLLRRIKALYGQSPIELVRTVRLKKAAELIQQGDNKLSEVGYLVGINSPSYFSKLFFKQFGIMPRDFAVQCHSVKKDE